MEARLWIGGVGITETAARSHAIAVYSRSVPAAAGAGSEDSFTGTSSGVCFSFSDMAVESTEKGG
jgi:hypothetical protein